MANAEELQNNRDILESENAPKRLILDNITHREYRSRAARLRSFDSWPKDHIVPREELSDSGFFYTGIDDSTVCFFCGVGLHSWQEGDNPEEVHKRFSPDCSQLLLTKSTDQESATSESSGSSESSLDDSEVTLDGRSIQQTTSALERPFPVEDVSFEELLEQNKQLKNRVTCKYCGDNPRDFVFIPCGHLVSCGQCVVENDIRTCPECDSEIPGSIKTYLYPAL